LRFSRVARYREDFDPSGNHTLEKDAQTSGLFLLSEGQTGEARLLEK